MKYSQEGDTAPKMNRVVFKCRTLTSFKKGLIFWINTNVKRAGDLQVPCRDLIILTNVKKKTNGTKNVLFGGV